MANHLKEVDQREGAPRLTRRQFIQAVGAVGGAAAVMGAMSAWGHMAAAKSTEPPDLAGGGGGTSVVILGAGPAGCVAGYELARKGYKVKILEAKDRVGGHVFTVRRGTHTEEYGGEKQVCDFDEGQWVDLGAWRIPYTHRGLQHYLTEFHIPCIFHTDLNMNAYTYQTGIKGPFNEKPVRLREAIMDMRGYTAEFLAKALDQDKLDTALSKEDRDAFIDYLISIGQLSRDDLTYGPNDARGWTQLEGAGYQVPLPSYPYKLTDLLPLAQATGDLTPFTELDHQPVMMKPAKGMSAIYEDGFQPALGSNLSLNVEVMEIHQSDSGVEIVYQDKQSGETTTEKADYCISTIPLSVLLDMPKADLSGPVREAMSNCAYQAVGKIGLQFKRRFWEEDDWIYGGITTTNIGQIGTLSYPTWDFHTQKGVLQAYYNFGVPAIEVSALSLKDRIEVALDFGSKIHPQYRQEFETGFSVAWHRMPYAKGGWANWSTYSRQKYYPTLIEPDGRIYFAGDFLSHIGGWQEGAIQAAWMQIDALHQRVKQG